MATSGGILELAREDVDAFLESRLVGRIGCHRDGRTYVVPVIYAYDGSSVYAASTEGRKIATMRANPRVCFEVDAYDERTGSWRSAIADGRYEELHGAAAARALALLATRFVARAGRRARPRRAGGAGKVVVFRIRIAQATGRAVVRA